MKVFFSKLLDVIFITISILMSFIFIFGSIVLLVAIVDMPTIAITTGVALTLLATAVTAAVWFYIAVILLNMVVAKRDFAVSDAEFKEAKERVRDKIGGGS